MFTHVMLPYMACYLIWHAILYGMLPYMACYLIWHLQLDEYRKYHETER